MVFNENLLKQFAQALLKKGHKIAYEPNINMKFLDMEGQQLFCEIDEFEFSIVRFRKNKKEIFVMPLGRHKEKGNIKLFKKFAEEKIFDNTVDGLKEAYKYMVKRANKKLEKEILEEVAISAEEEE